MKIKLKEVSVEDLVYGFKDLGEDGVYGYAGKLDIRPPYQRELVYENKEQVAVIDTLRRGLPLNVMYWSDNGDGSYELLDGQQRTMSICRYVKSKFAFGGLYFDNLSDDKQRQVLDYKLMIYICEGSYDDKIEWFETINIAGMKLTDQELLNALFVGPWLSDAKEYFSGSKPPASRLCKGYVSADANRQLLLEKVIKWHGDGDVKSYMAAHQNNNDAEDLIEYFEKVIDWAKQFPSRPETKSVNWSYLYDYVLENNLQSSGWLDRIDKLMEDEDIQKRSGIYEYVITGNERALKIRAFSKKQKQLAYKQQDGICTHCKKKFKYEEMEGDHILTWKEGGTTTQDNCQMLCIKCNRS